MRRSSDIGNIAKALAAAQAEYKPVPKTKEARVQTKKGGEYSYKYADLADVLGMAVPVLASHGISFLQPNERIDGKLFVTTLLIHESGEWMQSDGIEVDEMEWQWNDFEKKRVLERADPRTIGGDFTYYRRYDGCSFIGIAPDEDVDAKNNGPLPDRRGKNKTEASEDRMRMQASAEKKWQELDPEGFSSPQPGDKLRADLEASIAHETAKASPDPQKPQEQAPERQEYPFSYQDGILNARIAGIIEKETKPGKGGKTRPFLNVTFNGRAEGFNFFTVFDTKLFPVIQDCLDHQCEIALTFDGKFLGIKDVLSIDGVKLDQEPELPEPPEPYELDASDVPF